MQQTEKELLGFIWYVLITLIVIRLINSGEYVSAVLILIGAWLLRWLITIVGGWLLGWL